MRAKAKAKTKSSIEHQLEIFKRATEARYELAMRAYNAQDNQTKDALDIMVARLRTIGTGQIRIFPDGKRGHSVVVPIEPVLQDQNIMFLATEIFKDLALMDVQVANYEFPPVYCVECGDKISLTRRAKAKAKRQ